MQTLWRSSAAVLALIAGASSAAADSKEAWRLFVADRDRARVTVIDAIQGDITRDAHDEVAGFALPQQSADGRCSPMQGDGGAVTAIASGISFDDHGDHGDIEVAAPKLTRAPRSPAKAVAFRRA
jgi:zinc transport system substrate-binding protein